MRKLFLEIAAILAKYRRHKAWRRVVQVLSCVVVFCTTYALILPAITLETPGCGLQEHEHALDCYTQLTTTEQQLTCTLEASAEHAHAEECFTLTEIPVDGDILTCDQEESVEHFHAALCYGHWELTCELPVHIHTDACSEPMPASDETKPSDAETTGTETVPSTVAAEETEPSAAETTAEETLSSPDATEETEPDADQTDPTTETTEVETVPTEPQILELVYSDETVIVTVAYGPEANIPEGAQLVVMPITPESQSDTYQQRFDEAQQVLAEDESKPEITTFVLYDIHFEFEGQVIQPNESVSVTIQFLKEAGAVAGTPVSVFHFTEEGTEVLESTNIDETASTTFLTDGFSQYGISLLAEEADAEDTEPQAVTPIYPERIPATQTADEHLIAYFSFDDSETGFSSVTTSNGAAVSKGQMITITSEDSDNGDLLTLPNGDFSYDKGDSTNWSINGYSPSAVYEVENDSSNYALYLNLMDSETTGSASYTVQLTAGTYYFTFDLNVNQATTDRLSYTVSFGETALTNSISTEESILTPVKTESFVLPETTDVTFTLTGTDQPENFGGYLDNLQLHGINYSVMDYVDAKAESKGNVTIEDGYKGNAVRLSNQGYLRVSDFDGESLLSTLPNFSTLDAITVSYWSKPTNISGKNWSFFALPDESKTNIWTNDQHDLSILEETNYRLQQDHQIGTTRHERRISNGNVNTEWHYITAVFSNSITTLYVNGIKIGETEINEYTSLQSILGENSTVQIGKANYAANGEYYDGYIDEYRIYDIALSDDEVFSLFESEANMTSYQDSLLAHFDFNDINSGFTDAETGATATNSESVKDYYYPDEFYFTGENFLTVTNGDGSSLLTGCNEITVSYWSKPDDANHTNWGFYAAPDNRTQVYNNAETYLGLLGNGQYIVEQYDGGRNDNNLYSGGIVKADEWHYITAVYSETELRLYIDGQLIAKNNVNTNPTQILGENSILQIGMANYGDGEFYKGYMDEYRIYGTALTDAEVAQLYHNEANKNMSYTTVRAVPTDFIRMETGKQYLIYTQDSEGNYYAIAAKPGDTTGYAVPITFHDDGSFTWSVDTTDNFFWTFSNPDGSTGSNAGGQYLIESGSGMYLHAYSNNSAHGTVTIGDYTSTLETVYDSEGNPDGSFIATGNTFYTGLLLNNAESNINNNITLNSNIFTQVEKDAAAHLRLATIDYNVVWLDGTDGGLMAYGGAPNEPRFCLDSLSLPETWQSPSKYGYTLRGWYDITNSKYYQPGDIVTDIGENLVFYADWVPTTYDYGKPQPDEDIMASTLDTSDFISIEMFDYNALFNMQSLNHSGTVTETEHSENWNIVRSDEVPYNNMSSLNFIFRDWDNISQLSRPSGINENNEQEWNDNNTHVTSGIVGSIGAPAPALLDILFNRYQNVIGKNFVGNANHLFQFVDRDDPLYQGSENPGYYYYDSKYNAASYNQSEQRFYVYNYRERTNDSEGSASLSENGLNLSMYSDFLPFNSPYVDFGKEVKNYTIPIVAPVYNVDHYQYDAKYSYNKADDLLDSSPDNVIANYNFGMKININFFLPNDSAFDGSGELNQSEDGLNMLFGFEGDDDLWVFLDNKLVLDVGGIHGVRSGSINFSTGVVTVNGEETQNLFSSGDHTLTIYYLERGSSQSNCAIYFNLAPSRYGLELEKKDHDTESPLPGAKFNIYLDQECTQLAPIWHSEAEKKENPLPVTGREGFDGFTVGSDGKLNAWGFVLGKTYYLKEVTPPTGHLVTDDIIAFTMHTQGTLSYADVKVLPGDDGRDPGLEVIENQVSTGNDSETNQETLTLALALTNRKKTTQVRVDKKWETAEGNVNHPDITVHLLQNGKQYDENVSLRQGDNWTYTWDNLPVTDDAGNKYVYTVEEDVPPGYTAKIEDISSEAMTDWIDVAVLEDNTHYLLTNGGQALTVKSGETLELGWISLEDAKESKAFWTAEAFGSGFLLKFGNHQLTLGNDGTASLDSGNQILYYDGTTLYVVIGDGKCDFKFGDVSKITLQKPEMIVTKHFKITNVQGFKLPDTGSSFTLIYTASGLAIMAMAVLLELKRRRKHA